MRKYIGRLYVDYLFFNIFVISMICIVLISVIFKVIGFDKVFGVGIYLIYVDTFRVSIFKSLCSCNAKGQV